MYVTTKDWWRLVQFWLWLMFHDYMLSHSLVIRVFKKLGAEPTTLPISVFIKEIFNRNPIIADWILTGENKFQKIEKMGKSYKSGEPFYQVLWQEVVFDLSSFVKVRKMFQLLRKTKGSKLKSLIC